MDVHRNTLRKKNPLKKCFQFKRDPNITLFIVGKIAVDPDEDNNITCVSLLFFYIKIF